MEDGPSTKQLPSRSIHQLRNQSSRSTGVYAGEALGGQDCKKWGAKLTNPKNAGRKKWVWKSGSRSDVRKWMKQQSDLLPMGSR